MSIEIKKATRQGVKPLIGLYAESGCGKTYSALLLARGLVGPSGKILMVDTESGRGSQFADEIPGGYDVCEIRDDFNPDRYLSALQSAQSNKYDVVIFDSMSHEWEGINGVLDWAEKNKEAGKQGAQVWHAPKMAHARLVLAITQSPLPIICCMRAKYKTHFPKKGSVIKEVVKDDFTTPIQADDFIHEMLVHMEINRDHTTTVTKSGPPSLEPLVPNGRKITIQDGETLAKWCSSPSSKPAVKSEDQKRLASLKKKFFEMTEAHHHGNPTALQQWCWDESIMAPDQKLADFDADGLAKLIAKVESKFVGVTP